MGLIRVEVNSIFLPIVREDVKFKDSNNSFRSSFKVVHTTYPARIVESQETKKALGEFELDSSNKARKFPCLIYVGDSIYSGELIQNARIGRFRKVDLRFTSPVASILEGKISDFMPAENVLGQDPAANPYQENTIAELGAWSAWKTKASEIEGSRFPDVNWQLPQVRYLDLFYSEEEEIPSEFINYTGNLNSRNLVDNLLIQNDLIVGTDFVITLNYTAIAPMVFVLAPIALALESIGYRLAGSFVNSDLGKSLLFDTYNNNMSVLDPADLATGTPLTLPPGFTEESLTPPDSPQGVPFWSTNVKRVNYTTSEGSFRLLWDFELATTTDPYDHSGFFVIWKGENIAEWIANDVERQTGEVSFEVLAEDVGEDLTVGFYDSDSREPISYSLEVLPRIESTTFIDAHPTIEFNRYLPSWSVVDTINNISNLFNLKITIDDIRKVVSLDFNEADYLIGGPVTTIKKSALVDSFNNIEAERYILKFENDEDPFINVSRSAAEENLPADDQTQTIETKFRYVDRQAETAAFSEATKDKSGVGLLLYDPANAPRTSLEVDGIRLSLTGPNNIYLGLWRKWLKFRLNASNPTVKLPFSKNELEEIQQTKKIYLDNRLYLVKDLSYKETPSGKFLVELDLLSVTF